MLIMETIVQLVSILSLFQLTGAFDRKRLDEDEMWMEGFDFYAELEQGFKGYTGYGTEWIFFPDGDGVPHFVNLTMPASVQLRSKINKEIEYRLYIRGISDYVNLDQSGEPHTHINIRELLSNKPVKIVTHGWKSSAEDSVVIGIKESYLKHKDVAVIGVDWSDTANDYLYPVVAEYTGDVGAHVGQFLDAFCKLYDVSGDRLHLIGHSLGAHVMGIAATATNVRISRITGLDPARPLFEIPKKPTALSLDSSDAEFVDVIHSCSGVLGVENPIGNVDFYPNSGAPPQPGCGSIFFLLEACSHGRSYVYFAESIGNPTGFPACRSENWMDFLNTAECKQPTYMGDDVDRNATGQYYLKTNAKEPFATNNK